MQVLRPNRSGGGRARRGSIALEAILGLTLLMAVFLIIIHYAVAMWLQIRLEDEASLLVRKASRLPEESGATLSGLTLGGTASARIEWGEDNVWVRVEAGDGSAAAERLFPRERP